MDNPKASYHPLSGVKLGIGGGREKHGMVKLAEAVTGGSDPVLRKIAANRRTKLADYSITTVEEFVGAARAVPDKIQALLDPGIDLESLTSEGFLNDLAVRYPALGRFPQLEERKLTFGVRLETLQSGASSGVASEKIATMLKNAGKTELSLVENACMPAIRDQGQRWTCVSFATCALLEYAFCRERETGFDASEQFQYWDTKCHDPSGYTSLGTDPVISFARVKSAGVCRESTWTYDMVNDPPRNDPKGPAAAPEALGYKVRQSVKIIDDRNVTVLKNYLLDRHPIAVAIPVYDSWANNPAVTDSGNIGMPLPGETSQYGHALVLVGFADDGTFPGGGYFIIRNSYGTTWGAHCPFGAGYGTIPYRYIELDNYSAFIVRL